MWGKFLRVHGRMVPGGVLMGTGGAVWSQLQAGKDRARYFLPEHQAWNSRGQHTVDLQVAALGPGLVGELEELNCSLRTVGNLWRGR